MRSSSWNIQRYLLRRRLFYVFISLESISNCFPLFIGVHLKDLIAVDNALPDYVSDKKLINFQKMVKFYSVIATLMNFKNMQPPAPSKFELINMLRVSRHRIECSPD